MTTPTPSEARQVALLSCPFCGGEAREYNFVIEACVQCMACRASIIRRHQSHADTGLPEAITAWNRRALWQGGEAWQPIATAPKGRKVIALISTAGPNGYVTDPWTGWIEPDGTAARWPHNFPPTHWYALPPPPAEGEAA